MPKYLIFVAFIFVTFFNDFVFPAQLASVSSADQRWTVTLSVTPDVPRLSSIITLTVDITSLPGTPAANIGFSPFGEKLGELKIADIKTLPSQLVITAIPVKAGKTPIWEISVTIGEETVTLPKCELDIISAVSEQSASLDNVTANIPPINIGHSYWYWSIAVAVVILAVIVLLLLICNRKNGSDIPAEPLSLQELTLQKMQTLLDDRLYESDVRQFFVELADIVRWYVEQKTGIRTPELTSEEFLYRISQDKRFSDTSTVTAFLQTADFVKFAKHQPGEDEVIQAFRRAEDLVRFL